MSWVAWKMLVGNRTKYIVMLVGITFASPLIAQQCSIFLGVLRMSAGQIRDVEDASIWVIDPNVRYIDDLKTLPDYQLHQVRSVPGVEWAVGWRRGYAQAHLGDGRFQQVILQALDDDSLIGAPVNLLAGRVEDLREPDAVVLDEIGCELLWPGQGLPLGRVLTINDSRAVVVGVCRVSLTFQTLPLVYTRAALARRFLPPQRRDISAILARPRDDEETSAVCRRIRERTGLDALTTDQFCWRTIEHYLRRTGLLANFGTTVLIGFVVGVAVVGQTFYTFVTESLPHFAMLKAMGATNGRLRGMILLQAFVVGTTGYGLGVGMAAIFGEMTRGHSKLVFHMPWPILVGTGVAVLVIMILASMLSMLRVTRVEPGLAIR